MRELTGCPVCGGCPQVGRITKTRVRPKIYSVFCDVRKDHCIEVTAHTRGEVWKLWENLPRRSNCSKT